MLLAEPPPTQGDLHFRVLGFPVRVHPFFWVISLIMGLQGPSTAPGTVLSWIVAVFVSILIHELGHTLMQRHFTDQESAPYFERICYSLVKNIASSKAVDPPMPSLSVL